MLEKESGRRSGHFGESFLLYLSPWGNKWLRRERAGGGGKDRREGSGGICCMHK